VRSRMRSVGAGVLVLALALIVTAVSPAAAADLLLRVGNLDIPSGTVLHGDAIAVGGTLTVEGTVDGDTVALGGTVDVSGRVNGSVRASGGNVIVRSTAIIGGTASALGGRVRIDPGASIGGIHPGPPPSGPAPGPPSPSPFPGPQPTPGTPPYWWWGPAIVGTLMALHALYWVIVLGALVVFVASAWLTAVLFPSATQELAAVLEHAPGPALGVGLLGWVLLWPLVVLLAITIVGIVVLVFIPLVVLVMLQLGMTACALVVGRRIRPAVGGMGVEVLVGAIVLSILFAIPHLGGLFTAVVATWGWGAVLLALIERLRVRRVAPPSPPAPA
jgi:hypothetical protein